MLKGFNAILSGVKQVRSAVELRANPAGQEGFAGVPKRRGRKRTFASVQLHEAYSMKQAGKSNNEIAKVLYRTASPSPQQRRSVPTILRYHFRTKE